MVGGTDIKTVSKHIETIENWLAETKGEFSTGTGPITPAEFLASSTEIRSSAKEIFEAIAKLDSNGMATDALIKMFQEIILKHEDEVRERIISLISSGEKSAFAYYAMLLEFVKRESSLAELLPSADKIKEEFGNASFMSSSCIGHECVACTACVGCTFGLAVGTGVAGSLAIPIQVGANHSELASGNWNKSITEPR